MSDKLKTMEKQDEHMALPQDLLSSRQIDKLNLEIENLRKKNRWESLSPLVPFFASCVTVFALVIGFWQFQSQQSSLQDKAIREQQHERTTRLQIQLRSDVDEISRFTQDKSQTLSRVSFLLDDMNILIASASTVTDEQSSQAFRRYERTLTKSLVEQIVNDADFMKSPRDVSFATTISRNWSDYRNYLREKEQLDTLDRILYRYVRALRHLRDTNAQYFKEVSYDKDKERYLLPKTSEKREGEENLHQHFRRILDGFREHLNLISDDPKAQKIKQQTLLAFGDALCIESIARHVLGTDFIHRHCMAR